MHNILFEEYDLGNSELAPAVIHELLSDIYAFILSEVINVDIESFLDVLDFDAKLETVLNDAYHTVQAHEGARAQWKIIKDRLTFFGLESDFDLVKFLKSGVFIATAEVIQIMNARPVFVDIDPYSYNMCPDSLTNAIKEINPHRLSVSVNASCL